MMTTGECIGVLRAIKREVWGYDIPNYGNCAEYREHHEDCQAILKYIDKYIELIEQYDGIPRIQDMYPTFHVTMWEDSDAVPTDPDEYLKREV